MKNYFSLHTHTIKSIGDAILKIDDYIDKAKELNLTALSVTNHGTMSDVFEFYSKCKENNIKPIIGCEVYVTADRNIKDKTTTYDHLVLIAITKKGFENLLLIHNDAQINGFYKVPRTDVSFLAEHSEGIIALSACVGGTIPKKILEITQIPDEEQDKIAEEMLNLYQIIDLYNSIFDEFYLELQPGSFDKQIVVNDALIEISKDTGIPLIVTNDVHYLNEEDYISHNVHVCASRKKDVTDTILYPDKIYYMMNNEEIISSFKGLVNKECLEIAINNIYNIVDKVEDYDIIPDKIYMPHYEVPEGFNEDTYLEEICFRKLDDIKYKVDDIAEYTERLFTELDTIIKLGFSGYFLTVRDYVLWAKNNNIQVGPGRGSVCGSLVAYLTEIIKVDPVKYDLLFERFLSEHRPSPPDVDLDFDAKKRDLVFNYIVEKYGQDKCSLVSTFGERKAKAALKDTGKVHGIDKETCEYVAKLIPSVYYTDDEDGNSEKMTDLSIEDSLKIVPELKEYYDKYPSWFNSAIKLSNIPKSTSVHAAGTLISPIPLTNKIPMVRSKEEGLNATALNLKDAEAAGFIKFDFLSLSTLGVIDKTLNLIGESNTDFIGEEYDDPKVWELIGSKYTTGLFQIGSNLYKQRMGRLAPTTIKQLAACLALVRGPCISAKTDEQYMLINEGKAEIELIHPIYDKITHDTNGILIYQEQLKYWRL